MPTRKTLLIFVIAGAFFPLTAVTPVAAYGIVLLDAAILLVFLMDRLRLASSGSICLERHHRHVFSLAQNNQVELQIRNESTLAVRATVRDNPPVPCSSGPETLEMQIPAGHQAIRIYQIKPTERGCFHFNEAVVRNWSPLGLAFRDHHFPKPGPPSARDHSGDSFDFIVYPRFATATRREVAAFAETQESGYHKLQRKIEGTTPSQIRQWVPGDSYRNINWMATARYDHPMITQYDTDRNQTVYLFIDCGRLMNASAGELTKLDHATNAAADLTRLAIDRGDHVGLCCFSNSVKIWLKAKGRSEQMLRIMEALATLSANPVATNYDFAVNYFLAHRTRRSFCLFLTTFAESASTWDFLKRIHSLGPRNIPAVVDLTDPALETTLKEDPEDYARACRKLAATDLQEEAERFGEELKHKRGHFLQTPSQSVSATVLQSYLDVKSRGLL
ncbi:MAG: DUF58 domain-containing protein [Planctomycetes bacterium]|nr:DUF58 domain-containing protein [Planctomycetota bacterium]